MTDMRITFGREAFEDANFKTEHNPQLRAAIWCAHVEEDAGIAYEEAGVIHCFFTGENVNKKEALKFFKSTLTPPPKRFNMPSSFAKELRDYYETVAEAASEGRYYINHKRKKVMAGCSEKSDNHKKLWQLANDYEDKFIKIKEPSDEGIDAAARWAAAYCWVHGVRLDLDLVAAKALVRADGINWEEVDRLIAEQWAYDLDRGRVELDSVSIENIDTSNSFDITASISLKIGKDIFTHRVKIVNYHNSMEFRHWGWPPKFEVSFPDEGEIKSFSQRIIWDALMMEITYNPAAPRRLRNLYWSIKGKLERQSWSYYKR
jgi:hypothetical protein